MSIEGAPVQYLTVTPTDDLRFSATLLRIATSHVGAWGTRERNPGEPPRTFILFAWGLGLDVLEPLAVIDTAMGYVP